MEPEATQEAPKRRVKFGPRPNQTIPFEWAEDLLTQFAQHEPARFGAYLQHAAGLGELTLPSNGRGRRSQHHGGES
jgi:hypothetical protein